MAVASSFADLRATATHPQGQGKYSTLTIRFQSTLFRVCALLWNFFLWESAFLYSFTGYHETVHRHLSVQARPSHQSQKGKFSKISFLRIKGSILLSRGHRLKLYLIILLNRPPKSSAEEHDPNFLLRCRMITISVFNILTRLSVLGTGRHPSLDAKDKDFYLLHVKIGFFLFLLSELDSVLL